MTTIHDDAWKRFLQDEQTKRQKDLDTPRTQFSDDDRQVIVIQNNKSDDGNVGCCPGPGVRRIIILIAIYAIIVTAVGSFLAHLSLGIPGLNKQISALNTIKAELQVQVLNLTSQVDELTYQVDRLDNGTRYLSQLNDSLNQTVIVLNKSVSAYADENDRLNASNIIYQEENRKMNLTVIQNEVLIRHLIDEVGQLNGTINLLNDTKNSIQASLVAATISVQNLTASLEIQENVNKQLQNNTVQLNGALNETKSTVVQLSSINNQLTTIVGYLNTTGKFNVSFDVLRAELSSQILEKQALLYDDVHYNYDNKLSNIPCNFKATFASENWMMNMNAMIGSDDYAKVQNYLNVVYFSPVCADISDFQQFLRQDPGFGYSESNVTVNVLNSALSVYFGELLLYYFPLPGSTTGLSLTDWTTASFTCQNLASAKKFRYF